MILVGDINIDLLKKNSKRDEYLNIISSHGMENCNISIPIRVDILWNTSTLIDHIFVRTKKINVEINVSVIDVDISDHYPQFITIHNTTPSISKKYKNQITLIQDEIRLLVWGCLFHIQNPEDMYEELVQLFQKNYADTKIEKKKY